MEDIKKILDRPIAFHRCFITITGSVNAALMLSQAVYWSNRTSDPDGWFHKTAEEWEEEIGLSRHEQDNARAKLRKAGFWQEARKGAPATMHFRVDGEALQEKLLGVVQSSLPKSGKPDSRKVANRIAGKRQSRLPESGNLDSGRPANKIAGKPQTLLIDSETTAETTAESARATELDRIDELERIVVTAYRFQAIDTGLDGRIKEQVGKLNSAGCTPNLLKEFFTYRRKLPSLGFLASDLQEWRVNASRSAGDEPEPGHPPLVVAPSDWGRKRQNGGAG